MLGSLAVDIGSNDTEFWYWINKAEPPDQVYCSYKDLHAGRVRSAALPLDPEWLMETIGLGNYGRPEKYKLESNAESLRIVEKSTSPQGKPIRKIVILKRWAVQAPIPQILAYSLVDDASGREICAAEIKETWVDGPTGALLPRRIEFRWDIDEQKGTLLLKVGGTTVNPIIRPNVFTRRPMPSVVSRNLATEK